MLLLLVGLTTLVCLLYPFLINRLRGLPPGPPPLPFLGNLLSLDTAHLSKVFYQWRVKYGKVYTVWVPMPVVVYADHEILTNELIRDGETYGNRSLPEVILKVLVGGNYGLILNDNSIWREQRRFALHNLRDLGMGSAAIQEVMISKAQEAVRRWKAMGDEPFDVAPNITAAVANVIWQLLFGRTLDFDDPLFEKIRVYMREVLQGMSGFLPLLMEVLPPARHLDPLLGGELARTIKANDAMFDILEEEIKLVRKRFNVDDEPTCMMEAYMGEIMRRENNNMEKGSFTDHQAKIAAADLWSAGFETTVTTFRYAILYLINHPEAQRKMQREIDEKIGTRVITADDLQMLPYCQAVIQEVQRLAIIIAVPFMRETNREVTVDGHIIPARTAIMPHFPTVHVDPNEFKRPYLFCPERFIDKQGQFVKNPRVTPFSLGKRSCLGESLAKPELFIMLATSVQHLTFMPAGDDNVPPKLELVKGLLQAPQPYLVRAVKRID